jgi:hypothetical protein
VDDFDAAGSWMPAARCEMAPEIVSRKLVRSGDGFPARSLHRDVGLEPSSTPIDLRHQRCAAMFHCRGLGIHLPEQRCAISGTADVFTSRPGWRFAAAHDNLRVQQWG